MPPIGRGLHKTTVGCRAGDRIERALRNLNRRLGSADGGHAVPVRANGLWRVPDVPTAVLVLCDQQLMLSVLDAAIDERTLVRHHVEAINAHSAQVSWLLDCRGHSALGEVVRVARLLLEGQGGCHVQLEQLE